MSIDDAMRKAFDEQNECYEFPSENHRRGALNFFGWGWFAALRYVATRPAATSNEAAQKPDFYIDKFPAPPAPTGEVPVPTDEMVYRALQAFNDFPCKSGGMARTWNAKQMRAAIIAALKEAP